MALRISYRAIVQAFSITVDPLDFKAGRVRRWIECHGDIVKEAYLPQKIIGNIPREARLDFNDVRSDYEFDIVEVTFERAPGTIPPKSPSGQLWIFTPIDAPMLA